MTVFLSAMGVRQTIQWLRSRTLDARQTDVPPQSDSRGSPAPSRRGLAEYIVDPAATLAAKSRTPIWPTATLRNLDQRPTNCDPESMPSWFPVWTCHPTRSGVKPAGIALRPVRGLEPENRGKLKWRRFHKQAGT